MIMTVNERFQKILLYTHFICFRRICYTIFSWIAVYFILCNITDNLGLAVNCVVC